MEVLLDSIRIAVGDGASDDERRRGLLACRAVTDALAGGLVADCSARSPVAAADATALVPSDGLARGFAGPLTPNPFAGMTADQILDLAIAKLRDAVGDAAASPPVGQPFRLTLVPVPRRQP